MRGKGIIPFLLHMKKGEKIISVTLLIFSTLIYANTFKFPSSIENIGPKFFPRMIAILLFLLSLLLLFIDNEKKLKHINYKCLVINVLIIIGYILILNNTNFIVSTILFLFTYLYGISKVNIKKSILITSCGTAMLYIVFLILLKIPL